MNFTGPERLLPSSPDPPKHGQPRAEAPTPSGDAGVLRAPPHTHPRCTGSSCPGGTRTPRGSGRGAGTCLRPPRPDSPEPRPEARAAGARAAAAHPALRRPPGEARRAPESAQPGHREPRPRPAHSQGPLAAMCRRGYITRPGARRNRQRNPRPGPRAGRGRSLGGWMPGLGPARGGRRGGRSRAPHGPRPRRPASAARAHGLPPRPAYLGAGGPAAAAAGPGGAARGETRTPPARAVTASPGRHGRHRRERTPPRRGPPSASGRTPSCRPRAGRRVLSDRNADAARGPPRRDPAASAPSAPARPCALPRAGGPSPTRLRGEGRGGDRGAGPAVLARIPASRARTAGSFKLRVKAGGGRHGREANGIRRVGKGRLLRKPGSPRLQRAEEEEGLRFPQCLAR